MEHRRPPGAAAPTQDPYGADAARRLVQPRPHLRGGRGRRRPHRALPEILPALRGRRPASRSARPARPTSAPRTASCWSTRTCASAASSAPGPAPTARASSTPTGGVMKKCTLCVDRIYNENLRRERARSRPASRPARPARGISATSATRTRRLAPRRRARRLRPDAGDRLPAGQQYLPPRRARPSPAFRARRRCWRPRPAAASSLGSTGYSASDVSPTNSDTQRVDVIADLAGPPPRALPPRVVHLSPPPALWSAVRRRSRVAARRRRLGRCGL